MARPYFKYESSGGTYKWRYYDDDNPSGIDLDDVPEVIDEDDMASDSEDYVPTQQSTKAYVDNNTRIVVIKCIADDTALETGDGLTHFTIPTYLDGFDLVAVGAHVYTVSSSGAITIQIHNLTDTVDMLSTELTIDVSEKDSSTAAVAAVIDTAEDDVTEGDEIRIDVDGAGTDTLGLEIRMEFEKV